jgi:HEAT repeat protein
VPRPKGGAREVDLRVRLPVDLQRFLRAAIAPVGDYVPLRAAPSFSALLSSARSKDDARARLGALLASAVPFGKTRGGELWLYVLAPRSSPARAIVATLDPRVAAPRLVCRGASTFAVMCSIHASGDEPTTVASAPGVAEQEAVRSSFERALVVRSLLLGSDAAVRKAARILARKPEDEPPLPDTRGPQRDRAAPLALGALVETFFRADDARARTALALHDGSDDEIVADAVRVLGAALDRRGAALPLDLARRRAIALRAMRAAAAGSKARAKVSDTIGTTRAIMAKLDAMPIPVDPVLITEDREENLLALAELGNRSLVPSIIARAVTGDIAAVEMLGMLGDARAIPHLVDVLAREPQQKHRLLETSVVRALARMRAQETAPLLRKLLADNPMTNWRDGIERAVLVRELVSALGALRDEAAGPALLAVLESTSQEYRASLPLAAWALGRIAYLPALRTLERLLCSPKEPATCEALWAVGEIGRKHTNAKKRAGALLDSVAGLEPGAEMTRLTALAKVRGSGANAPKPSDLRRALERALWEPGFRQEETVRRRTWALRSLRGLHGVDTPRGRDLDSLFLGHEAVRYLVTRDDARVRFAAERAFSAWNIPVPKARRYYAVVVDELEREGGLEALHDAIRDPLGVYRHNVATRLSELADARSVRPLAEATARIFAEPVTSTYEYDDAPKRLVAFVRALARLNRPEGNDVLIDALRNGNHQVRAVVAENAPEDERFVPELRAMLGDPRSFLRSRAERSLTSLGVLPALPALDQTGSNAAHRRVEV